MSDENTCSSCGCGNPLSQEDGLDEQDKQEEQLQSSSREETHLAILLALVPAMTMTLFNLMGLV